MKKIIDNAIVLRRVNYGESDRVITLLTQENGKITVFAKGVRKQKSRVSGGIELLCLSEVGFIEGKSSLNTLTSANLISHYDGIVQDLDRTSQAFEALKQIASLSDDGAGQEYFPILRMYLRTLSDYNYDKNVVWIWFCLKVLNTAGLLGEIRSQSIEQGNTKYNLYNFDFESHCFINSPDGLYTQNDIKLLRLLSSNNKPIKLEKSLGSENTLTFLINKILLNNLTYST